MALDHYLPYSSHLYPFFILHPCLYWPVVGYTSHYLPYLSSSIYPFLYSGGSLLSSLIILHFHLSRLYSAQKFTLLFNIFPITHLLTHFTQLPFFIYSKITYLLHFLNSPLYIPNYLHFPYSIDASVLVTWVNKLYFISHKREVNFKHLFHFLNPTNLLLLNPSYIKKKHMNSPSTYVPYTPQSLYQ